MRRDVLAVTLCIAVSLLSEGTVVAGELANPLHLRPHHATARVSDLDRAAGWYQRMLGFTVTERGNHGDVRYVELAIPGYGISLIKEPFSDGSPSRPDDASPGWLHIVFAVPDLATACRGLARKGASLTVRKSPNGHIQSVLVTDSEGNEVELIGETAR